MELNIKLGNTKSINDAIDKLKKIRLGTEFDDEVVNSLVKTCYDKCFENLEAHRIYSNTQFREVKKAITYEKSTNGVGYVKIGYPAIMVEFGTGVVGATSRNPKLEELGFWDENDSRERWVYATDEGASNPYKWQSKNGNWYAWTHGVQSRPFAYESSLYIREIAKDEVKKALRRALGK